MKDSRIASLLYAVGLLCTPTVVDAQTSPGLDLSAPEYYDLLRQNNQTEGEGSEESNVFLVQDDNYNTTLRLCDITAFLPLSADNVFRPGIHNDAALALLAAYHFNNPELSPIVIQDVASCNVKLTLDIIDTRFSPIEATKLFTDVLQSNHSLETPLPTAVVGAYRSAVTSPLAVLSGVNDIPQVSYSATSTDFEVTEQFPRFGRTITSGIGEAQAALELFVRWEATHIGVLFVTDAYGSSLQKAFQDATSAAGIVTESIGFSFSSDSEGIPNAVKRLKESQFRMFYVICFESHYRPIMESAHNEGIVGEGFLWTFPGLDIATFIQDLTFDLDSPLAKATEGVGLLQFASGVDSDPYFPGEVRDPPLAEDPSTGFEKLRIAWRDAVTDVRLTSYFRSKLPDSLEAVEGFDRAASFAKEPSNVFAPFLYDAVMALGLSICRAGVENTVLPTGTEIFNAFLSTDFEGASGRVLVNNVTGTRESSTHTFVLYNLRPYPTKDLASFSVWPAKKYVNGQWSNVEGNEFIFPGGGTTPPSSLPKPDIDMNFIGDVARSIGYSLMGVVMALSTASVLWMWFNRKTGTVRSAQPLFLLMVSIGTFIMSSTIIPLAMEEDLSSDRDTLNRSCRSIPWLYIFGSVCTFSALLAKIRGVYMVSFLRTSLDAWFLGCSRFVVLVIRCTPDLPIVSRSTIQAYSNPELDFIHVSNFDIFGAFLIIFGVNLVIMIPWSVTAPLHWSRVFNSSTDSFGRSIDSYGSCINDDSLPFLIVLGLVNFGFLLGGNWIAFRARNIETEYHESRYVSIGLASFLQAWGMGIPILIVVWDDPPSRFFVSSGIVFVTSFAVLLLIFVPKVLVVRSNRRRKNHEVYRDSVVSKRDEDVFDEDENDSPPTDSHNGHNGSNVAMIVERPGAKAVREESTKQVEQEVPPSANRGKEHASNGTKQKSSPPVRPSLMDMSHGTSFQNRMSQSMIGFGPGAMKSSEAPSSMRGIKVTHHPRSAQNLQMARGRELSKKQLHNLASVESIGLDSVADNLPSSAPLGIVEQIVEVVEEEENDISEDR